MSVKKATRKSPVRKSSVKKATAKKVVKKTPVKKTTTKKTTAKKDLAKPQIKILQVLSKFKHPVTRKQLVEKGIEATSLGGYIGLNDLERRAIIDKREGDSLITRKYVKLSFTDDITEKGVVYSITDLGRKSLGNIK